MKTDQCNEPGAAEGMVNAVGERTKGCVDAGVSALNAVAGKARQIGQSADTCVRENPWIALGVVAGVGVLVGYLLRGRRES